jgi:hypothetical protein
MFTRPLIALVVATSLSVGALAADSGKKVKIKGHLVDVQCSIEEKEDPAVMRTTHSRSCFQMPACEKSGYALLTEDDKVLRFDATGNERAKKLVAEAKKDKDYRVTVRGKLDGETLAVNKIELDK